MLALKAPYFNNLFNNPFIKRVPTQGKRATIHQLTTMLSSFKNVQVITTC